MLGRALLALALGAALVAGGGPASAAARTDGGTPPLVVHTEEGAVRGTMEEGYRLFQDIPFAAPPVGDLRFRPPAPVASHASTAGTSRVPGAPDSNR
jgi:para-nitrobenzyl esterase